MNESGFIRRKRVGFAQVSNTCLRDPSLSLTAKGLYSLIQSLITNTDFKIYKSILQRDFWKEGKSAFDNAWKELTKAGFLKMYKINTTNGFIYEYELLDEPEKTDDTSAWQGSCGSKTISKTIKSLKNSEKYISSPDTDFPDLGNPHLGNPGLGNRTLNNTYSNNTDLSNIYSSNNIDVVCEKNAHACDTDSDFLSEGKGDCSDCYAIVKDDTFNPAMFEEKGNPTQDYLDSFMLQPWNRNIPEACFIDQWRESQTFHHIFNTRYLMPHVSEKVVSLKCMRYDAMYANTGDQYWQSARKELIKVLLSFKKSSEAQLINNGSPEQFDEICKVAMDIVEGDITCEKPAAYLAVCIRSIFRLS